MRNFLINVAKKLGQDPISIEPLLQELEKDWFDTIDSLKKIPDDMWEEYSIPEPLLIEIKAALKNYDNKQINPEEEKIIVETDPSLSSNEMIIDDQEDVWKDMLENISANSDNLSDSLKSLSVLNKIVKNIIENPSDPNKRKLQLENPMFKKTLGKHQSAMNFFYRVMFTKIIDWFQKDKR